MVPTVDTQVDYLHLREASILSVIPFAALKFKDITAGFKTCGYWSKFPIIRGPIFGFPL